MGRFRPLNKRHRKFLHITDRRNCLGLIHGIRATDRIAWVGRQSTPVRAPDTCKEWR